MQTCQDAQGQQGQDIPNTYHVMHAEGPDVRRLITHGAIKSQIVFEDYSLGDQVISAPDPKIIALHAACARIAHMSGAVEHFRELYGETDDISVMTEPNAADELHRALKALQTIPSVT